MTGALLGRPRAGWLVTAVLAAGGLVTEGLRFGWARPDLWVPDLLTGWSLLGCGLVVSRAPSRQRGSAAVLLWGSGFLWFLNNIVGNGPVLVWLEQHSGYWHRAPMLHLVITYPIVSARTARRRVAVGSAYAACAVPWVWADPWAATAAGIALVGLRSADLRAAPGLSRQLAGRALAGAIGLAAAFGVAPVVASLAGATVGEDTTLLTYEALVGAVAVGLAIPLARPAHVPVEVTDLVVRVTTSERDTSVLRNELATTLGDPTLELGYWLEDVGGYVDATGRTLHLGALRPHRAVTPVTDADRPVAVLVHEPASLADPQVRRAVELAIRLGSTNARLRLQLATQLGELEASARRIVRAAMDSREAIGQQLQTGTEQRLCAVGSLLDALASTSRPGTNKITDEMAQLRHRLQNTVDDLGRLARGLHPRDLAEQGLPAALSARLADLAVTGELRIDLPPDVPDDLLAMTYFVCAEALTNVAKHARAASVGVTVRLSSVGELVVEVADDGCGGAALAVGSGLAGLADRVATFGGRLALDSPLGGGTRLSVCVPTGTDR